MKNDAALKAMFNKKDSLQLSLHTSFDFWSLENFENALVAFGLSEKEIKKV